jgi:isoleucyl-tRNA synthetase
VQDLRKQAELEIADRIRLSVMATPDLIVAIQTHREYVMAETLAIELVQAEPLVEAATSEAWFDGQWVKFGVVRAFA